MSQAVEAVKNVYDDIEDQAKRSYDDIEDAAKEAGSDIFNEAGRAWEKSGMDDVFSEAMRISNDTIGIVNDGFLGWCSDCHQFVGNVNDGFYNNLRGMNTALANGDWKGFAQNTIGALQTIIYVAAFIVGAITGNVWLMAAAVVALDGQHNGGALTANVVEIAGKIETMITGTEIISRNAEYITMTLIVVASIYAGAEGFGYLADVTGISSACLAIAQGTNSIYEAYREYQYWQDYYSSMMAQYQSWLDGIEKLKENLNDAFFEMMGDADIFLSSFAGGVRYTESGAGGIYFTPSAVYDPNAITLGYFNKNDQYMDAVANNFNNFDFINVYDKNTIAKTNSIF